MKRAVAVVLFLLTVQSSETVVVEETLVTRDTFHYIHPEPEPEPTPIADSRIDWVEQERQNACLWEFLQASGVELTLQSVLAAGEWTDALGGACAVIGED